MCALRMASSLFLSLLFSLLFSLIIRAHGDADDNDGGGPGGGSDLHHKPLFSTKLTCLIIMLVSTSAGGISPCFFRWNKTFILHATNITGKFFLAKNIDFLDDVFAKVNNKFIPFGLMLASASYLLTKFGDRVISYTAKSYVTRKQMSQRTSVCVRFRDALLCFLFLCFHSFFEGMAVGLARTKADAWRKLCILSLQKIFAAIAMGIASLRLFPKWSLIARFGYSFAWAVSGPVGVGIGIAIDATKQGAVADLFYAISMSIAVGVFVYDDINKHRIENWLFKPVEPNYFNTPFSKFFAVVLWCVSCSSCEYHELDYLELPLHFRFSFAG